MAKKFFRNNQPNNPLKKKKNNKKKKTEDDGDGDVELVGQSTQVEDKKPIDESDGNTSDDNYDDLRSVKTKKNKKSGGFQSMGLAYSVLKGVLRKGYRVPTPIQRKAIPEIMSGKDVVAMARTGSGKTAAFLLPLLDKLRSHSAKVGIRGLIISPTRELALQTHKFAKELSKFTDLKTICILGGDSMERQFEAIHDNPDIMIATPGRLLHVMVEMNLKLLTVEYIVFDEADRLFEMGFKEQLNEILSRLPDQRQTLLFSATLPQQIVDFTKAGLNDPVLIRLDTESKLSENLRNVFISCRGEEKTAVLLYLVKYIISISELTVIFVETRHHVEYLKDVLTSAQIECTYLYSTLDMEARKMNVQNFKHHKVKVLLVTDVAARGVDIPLLDNVINYNFPAKSKLFVHRVGRVARAGRIGTAYSLVAPDEMPFVYSLNLFLNREFKLSKPDSKATEDGLLGSIPQHMVDEETEVLERLHSLDSDLNSMKKVCSNAYKQYIKSRPTADSESVRNVKEIVNKTLDIHPIFKDHLESVSDSARMDLLSSIRSYKPNSTIFETGKTKGSVGFEVMQKKRKIFGKIVEKFGINKKISAEFDQTKDKFKDNEFFVPYHSTQHFSEKGLELEKPFNAEIASAVLDFNGDESESINRVRNQMKWDRKKKKFVQNGNQEQSKKKIKTESGNWIQASYKSDLYKKWKIKSKAEQQDSDEEVNEEKTVRDTEMSRTKVKNKNQKSKRPPRRELKTRDEIYKERQKLERKKSYQKWKQNERQKKKAN